MKTEIPRFEKAVNLKLNQWSREASIQFAIRGAAGEKMHRELWANGETMVGWKGARANQMLPLQTAIQIFKSGWKVFG